MIGEIRTYRPTPPLQVWRGFLCGVPIWRWLCRLCGDGPHFASELGLASLSSWEAAFAIGLDHVRRVHACPSMRASGEPCDEYCTDCGGRMWIY